MSGLSWRVIRLPRFADVVLVWDPKAVLLPFPDFDTTDAEVSPSGTVGKSNPPFMVGSSTPRRGDAYSSSDRRSRSRIGGDRDTRETLHGLSASARMVASSLGSILRSMTPASTTVYGCRVLRGGGDFGRNGLRVAVDIHRDFICDLFNGDLLGT